LACSRCRCPDGRERGGQADADEDPGAAQAPSLGVIAPKPFPTGQMTVAFDPGKPRRDAIIGGTRTGSIV
jgi:hypothetical protein